MFMNTLPTDKLGARITFDIVEVNIWNETSTHEWITEIIYQKL